MATEDFPRPFRLHRYEDVTGASGTGLIATGVQFTDGTVVIRWGGETPSTVVWPSIEAAKRVHGHGGKTRIVWLPDCYTSDDDEVLTTGEVASYLPEDLRGRYWRQAIDRYFTDELARPDATTLRDQIERVFGHDEGCGAVSGWDGLACDCGSDAQRDRVLAVIAEHGLVEREARDE